MSRTICIAALGAFAVSAIATEPLLLENEFLRIAVDPANGGAITSVLYKKAIRFPFIAERGAGVAATGALFVPWIESDGTAWKIPAEGVRSIRADGGRTVTITFLPAAGVTFERRLSLSEHGTEFSLRDSVRNGSDRAITVRTGLSTRQQAEPWRREDRSWIGDGSRTLERHLGEKGNPASLLVAAGPFFWRQTGQYGTGLLCRTQGLPVPAELKQEYLPEPGSPSVVVL